MTDKKRLPKLVPTRESEDAPVWPVFVGCCNPGNRGRPGVFIEVPKHIYPLIGVEGGAMAADRRVTVLGYMNSDGFVQVSDLDGHSWWEDPDVITPAPKTRTVTLEVDASVDPQHLSLFERGKEPYSGQDIPYRIVAIDSEEVDDE